MTTSVAHNHNPAAMELDLTGVAPGTILTVGRGEQCDVIIDDPAVSAVHFQITVAEDGAFLRDLQSRAGVMLNGQSFHGRRRLHCGDLISLPEHDFIVKLPDAPEVSGERITLSRVTVTAGTRELLQALDMEINPGEFVGIIGPSGCGKSTLLKVLTGTLTPASGSIELNDHPVTAAELRHRTGYLPQGIIVPAGLTPAEILADTIRLYRPRTTPHPDDLLVTTGLDQVDRQIVATLSGGQQKRVGLAQELLFAPEMLCLDEVTSGLDPQSERAMMRLFRDLADRGRTLLCVTHYPERLVWCDKLVVLQAGRLRFCGTPTAALKYFGITGLEQLYDALSERDWPQVDANDDAPPSPSVSTRKRTPLPSYASPSPHRWRQWLAFVRRYGRIMRRSRGEMGFNLLQGILIGILIGFCFGSGTAAEALPGRDNRLVFALVLAAIWTGATAAVREIVKERVLLRHESRRGISPPAYLAAKFVILLLPAWLVIMLITIIVAAWTGLAADWPPLCGILLLTSALSVMLGLLLSAWCATQEKALLFLPVAIIALIMFSGGIQPLQGYGKSLARRTCYAYWAYRAAGNTLKPNSATPAAPPAGTTLSPQRRDTTADGIAVMLLHFMVFAAAAMLGIRRLTR
ncbi:MAG: ATP-binding cassette domain-containing protein [Victivallales bacterium]|nr:ATP-binding cassette domain-containing protein [Victivallales bacterium]